MDASWMVSISVFILVFGLCVLVDRLRSGRSRPEPRLRAVRTRPLTSPRSAAPGVTSLATPEREAA